MQRLFLTAVLGCFVSTTALAAPQRCGVDLTPREQTRFDRFLGEIEGSGTADEARELALKKVKSSEGILRKARALAPKDQGLADAQAKVDAFRADVLAAQSQQEVAGHMRGMLVGGGGCTYTTGEVIATVLGFILGIIPGIILLILLC